MSSLPGFGPRRAIAAVLFFISALLGLSRLVFPGLGLRPMDGFGSLGLDCRLTNSDYDLLPLGWIFVASNSCDDYYYDFSAVAIIFLSVCVTALAACGILVLVIRKLTTAGSLIGFVLAMLCAIESLLVVGSGFLMGSPLVVRFYLPYLFIPVILAAVMRNSRPGLISMWRVLLILDAALILIGFPSFTVMSDSCGIIAHGCLWLHPNLLYWVSEYVFQNIGNLVLFPALFILAFASRSTQKADEKIPREDASSVWYGVLGFVIPIAGLIGWLMWRKPTPLRARSVGIGALVGTIAYAIVGVVYYLINHSNTMNALY